MDGSMEVSATISYCERQSLLKGDKGLTYEVHKRVKFISVLEEKLGITVEHGKNEEYIGTVKSHTKINYI